MDSLTFSEIFSPIQLLAWVGVIFYVISFQILDPRKTLAIWIPANLLFAAHFYFLDALPAVFVAVGSAIREACAVFAPQTIFNTVLIAYTVSIWGAAFYFAEGLYDYLPALGTTSMSIGIYLKKNFFHYRLFAIGHNVAWIIFNVIIGSYAGMAQIILMFSSNVIGIGRYILKQRA